MSNEELRLLYEADQEDRRTRRLEGMIERDAERRAQAKVLVDTQCLQTADDYFHAALIFQHSMAVEDNDLAHRMAKQAAALGHRHGRWLAAATLDRSLVHQGEPQRYGTQFHAVDGRWELHDVDPAITDDERAAWNVPPLRDAIARAERMTAETPPRSWPA